VAGEVRASRAAAEPAPDDDQGADFDRQWDHPKPGDWAGSPRDPAAALLAILEADGVTVLEARSVLAAAWHLGWLAGHGDAAAHRVPATPDPFWE
jgi:hypothetical protein